MDVYFIGPQSTIQEAVYDHYSEKMGTRKEIIKG